MIQLKLVFFIQRLIFPSSVFTLFCNLERLLSDMAKKVSSANRTAEVESSRTHFEVLGLEGQVLGLGLEASSPRNLACPRLEESTIF